MKQPDPVEVVTNFVASVIASEGDVFLGIDPGAEGAIALVCGKKYCVIDIPTLTVARKRVKKLTKEESAATGKKTRSAWGTKTAFNNAAIVSLFTLIRPLHNRVLVCLEQAQVQVRGKGANAYTAFRVGCGYNMWPLFLAGKGYYVEEVAPSVWKRAMGLTSEDKEAARHKALSLFPRGDFLLRKEDHNRAEALLLAEYLRRKRHG